METSIFLSFPWNICWITDEYTATYIHRLTDKCTEIYSSVEDIFLSTGTNEYKRTKQCTLFSCSVGKLEDPVSLGPVAVRGTVGSDERTLAPVKLRLT
jgi:hypothetical protein